MKQEGVQSASSASTVAVEHRGCWKVHKGICGEAC